MLDVVDLSSSDTRVPLQRVEAEVHRLYVLPDRWLAEALLKLARQAREENPGHLGMSGGMSYAPNFTWHVIPELAKRLGAKPRADECGPGNIYHYQDGRQFREAVGLYLVESSLAHGLTRDPERSDPYAIDLLSRSIAQGNPVAFAIDRLVEAPPAGEDAKDPIARALRAAGRARGCGEVVQWNPEFHRAVKQAI